MADFTPTIFVNQVVTIGLRYAALQGVTEYVFASSGCGLRVLRLCVHFTYMK